MLDKVLRRRNPPALLMELCIVTATMGNTMKISVLKIMNQSTIWPSNPTSGHMPWENRNSERKMYPNAHCRTIYNIKDIEVT